MSGVKPGGNPTRTPTGRVGYPLRPALANLNPRSLDFVMHGHCDISVCFDTIGLKSRACCEARYVSGEELTLDYSTWEIDDEWRLAGHYNCPFASVQA